jgi:hypothetical protein
MGCNGQIVDGNTKKRHERYDSSQSYHDLIDVVCHHLIAIPVTDLVLVQHGEKPSTHTRPTSAA